MPAGQGQNTEPRYAADQKKSHELAAFRKKFTTFNPWKLHAKPVTEMNNTYPRAGTFTASGGADALSDQTFSMFHDLAASVDAEKAEQLRLLDEINVLERKIEEVNKVLCKETLSYMVRFQLKDDLEFYHGIINRKRKQMESLPV